MHAAKIAISTISLNMDIGLYDSNNWLIGCLYVNTFWKIRYTVLSQNQFSGSWWLWEFWMELRDQSLLVLFCESQLLYFCQPSKRNLQSKGKNHFPSQEMCKSFLSSYIAYACYKVTLNQIYIKQKPLIFLTRQAASRNTYSPGHPTDATR